MNPLLPEECPRGSGHRGLQTGSLLQALIPSAWMQEPAGQDLEARSELLAFPNPQACKAFLPLFSAFWIPYLEGFFLEPQIIFLWTLLFMLQIWTVLS